MQRKINVGSFEIGTKEKDIVNSVLDSGRITEGKYTKLFEDKWKKIVGTDYCVSVNSGTSALISSLLALKHVYNIDSGTKVITTPLTYIADTNAIKISGLEPVFADIDPVNFCITPDSIKQTLEQIKDDCNIILPVDLMGYPVKIDEIMKIDHDICVIEDAAEAHGSKYKGNMCGSQADVSVFSFYVAHNIQAGELGAITTNNEDIHNLVKQIKANGRSCTCEVCVRSTGNCPSTKTNNLSDPRFTHNIIGYNFKTTDLQTSLGLVQIDNLSDIVKRRQYNVRYLNDCLNSLSDQINLPLYDSDVSYLAYPIVITDTCKISRNKLLKELETCHIETRPLFGCIPTQQPAYTNYYNEYKDKLPNANYIGSNGFYIGCHQYLSDDDLEYIIKTFKNILV